MSEQPRRRRRLQENVVIDNNSTVDESISQKEISTSNLPEFESNYENVNDINIKKQASSTQPSKNGRKVFCPECGARVSETQRFCSRCGFGLKGIAGRKKQSNKILWLVIIILIFLLGMSCAMLAMMITEGESPSRIMTVYGLEETPTPMPTSTPTPASLFIPLKGSNLQDFVNISAEFSGYSTSYGQGFYFADATLNVECTPLEDLVFHDARFTINFDGATLLLGELSEWDISSMTIALSQLGRAKRSQACDYVSILGRASEPVAEGNYVIRDVSGTVEVKYGSNFYNIAQDLYMDDILEYEQSLITESEKGIEVEETIIEEVQSIDTAFETTSKSTFTSESTPTFASKLV